MLGREPAVIVRKGERVYKNDDGWSCLVQGVRAAQFSQVVCVRGEQMIVYRVA